MTPDDELKSVWDAQPAAPITMNTEVLLQQIRGNKAVHFGNPLERRVHDSRVGCHGLRVHGIQYLQGTARGPLGSIFWVISPGDNPPGDRSVHGTGPLSAFAASVPLRRSWHVLKRVSPWCDTKSSFGAMCSGGICFLSPWDSKHHPGLRLHGRGSAWASVSDCTRRAGHRGHSHLGRFMVQPLVLAYLLRAAATRVGSPTPGTAIPVKSRHRPPWTRIRSSRSSGGRFKPAEGAIGLMNRVAWHYLIFWKRPLQGVGSAIQIAPCDQNLSGDQTGR